MPSPRDPGEAAARRRPRPWAVALVAWLGLIGIDLPVHAGALARFYVESHPFLLPPEQAFARIPLGYLAYLLTAGLLVWLMIRLDVRGASAGARFGLLAGLAFWGVQVLGLVSIATAPGTLLLGWLVGQSLGVGVGGALAGAALDGTRLRRLVLVAVGIIVAGFVLTVVLQSTGLAPAVTV